MKAHEVLEKVTDKLEIHDMFRLDLTVEETYMINLGLMFKNTVKTYTELNLEHDLIFNQSVERYNKILSILKTRDNSNDQRIKFNDTLNDFVNDVYGWGKQS